MTLVDHCTALGCDKPAMFSAEPPGAGEAQRLCHKHLAPVIITMLRGIKGTVYARVRVL